MKAKDHFHMGIHTLDIDLDKEQREGVKSRDELRGSSYLPFVITTPPNRPIKSHQFDDPTVTATNAKDHFHMGIRTLDIVFTLAKRGQSCFCEAW
eukprot:scaffold514_cov150-Skeletonema_dohrnii-CCMP3373.AAC.3